MISLLGNLLSLLLLLHLLFGVVKAVISDSGVDARVRLDSLLRADILHIPSLLLIGPLRHSFILGFVPFVCFFGVLLIVLFTQVGFGGVLVIEILVFVQILNHNVSLWWLFGRLIQQFWWRRLLFIRVIVYLGLLLIGWLCSFFGGLNGHGLVLPLWREYIGGVYL